MTTTTETITSTPSHAFTLREPNEEEAQAPISTSLHYLKPPQDPNERLWYRRPAAVWPAGTQTVNYEAAAYPVTITDARGKQPSSFALDTHGFAFGACPNGTADLALLERVRAEHDADGKLLDDIIDEYSKTMEKMLLEKTGASKVVLFDHLVRKRPTEFQSSDIGVLGAEATKLDPVRGVHVDQSREYGFGFLDRFLQDNPNDFVTSRAQIINVWRPLIDGVEDFPLAVLDWGSVSSNEVHPTKAVYLDPKYDRENFRFTHNPNHKWYFLSKQKKDEAIFIKCFDSNTDVAPMAAHTAFLNPTATPGSPPRESIEVRAWVFYEGKDELQYEVEPEWAREDLHFTTK